MKRKQGRASVRTSSVPSTPAADRSGNQLFTADRTGSGGEWGGRTAAPRRLPAAADNRRRGRLGARARQPAGTRLWGELEVWFGKLSKSEGEFVRA
jgi:hypothetical protein